MGPGCRPPGLLYLLRNLVKIPQPTESEYVRVAGGVGILFAHLSNSFWSGFQDQAMQDVGEEKASNLFSLDFSVPNSGVFSRILPDFHQVVFSLIFRRAEALVLILVFPTI